jgi:hypothetical protein
MLLHSETIIGIFETIFKAQPCFRLTSFRGGRAPKGPWRLPPEALATDTHSALMTMAPPSRAMDAASLTLPRKG